MATLLETARALQAGPALKNDVVFLYTDGEEVGLLGAQAFVEQHPWVKEVGLVLNFDTGGDTGIVYTYETSPGNARLISEYAKAIHHPAASSMMYAVYSAMPNESDFTPFKRAGFQGLNLFVSTRVQKGVRNDSQYSLRSSDDPKRTGTRTTYFYI